MKLPIFSLLLTCVSATCVRAGFVDEFTGGVPQQTWTFAAPPPPTGGPFTQTYSASSGGYLELGTPQPPGVGASAIFGFVAENFGAPGVVVRATLNPNNVALSRDVGILANLNPAQLNGYGLTIDYIAGEVDMTVIRLGNPENLGSAVAIPNFVATNTYDVELEIVGGVVTGRVFDATNTLLQTLNDNNSEFTSGFAGVVVNREASDATVLGTWGRVSATAVPEPGTGALLVAGLLPLLAVRRRTEARE